MRTYKRLDFIIQVLLIAGSLLYVLFINRDSILAAYFITGGWQLLSCLIHGIIPDYYPTRHRKYYLRTLLVIFILAILCIPVIVFNGLMVLILGYGFILLVISPGLAIWYASICYLENELLEHKEWVHLK